MLPAVWIAAGAAAAAVAGLAAWRHYTRGEDRLALPEPEGRFVVVKERKADGHLLSLRMDQDPGLHISWPQSLVSRGLPPLPGARGLSDPVARRMLASGVVERSLRPLEPLGDLLLRGRELQLRVPGKLGDAEAWLLRAAEALDKAAALAREQETAPATLAGPDLRAALVDHPELDHGFREPCRAWIQDFAERTVLLEAPLRASLDAQLHLKARGALGRLVERAHAQWSEADEGRFDAWLEQNLQVPVPERDRDAELAERWAVQGELPEAWERGLPREALLVLADLGAELDATRVLLRVPLDEPELERKLLIVARAARVLSGTR